MLGEQGAGARRLGRWGAQAWALGRLGARRASERAGTGGRAGGRRVGARGAQAGRRQPAWQGQQAQAGHGRERAGRARRAAWECLCAQAGRASWSTGPSWCTVHLAHFLLSFFFNSVFGLGIFPESLNEHCSL